MRDQVWIQLRKMRGLLIAHAHWQCDGNWPPQESAPEPSEKKIALCKFFSVVLLIIKGISGADAGVGSHVVRVQ